MKKKEISIIKLLASSSDYISSYEIATNCAMSQRSVRLEMREIKKTLETIGYTLISTKSKGYRIKENSPQDIQSLSNILKREQNHNDYAFPTMPIERGTYIMKRLVENDDYIKIDTLADELLTSRSTITQSMKYVKRKFNDNNLHFMQKPNFGIKVDGSEINIRKILCDVFFLNLNNSDMLCAFLDAFTIDYQSIEFEIIQTLDQHHIIMSDIGLCDLLISIIVSINRVKDNKTIILNQDTSFVKNRVELLVAKEILHIIFTAKNITFSEEEAIYLAIQIICKQSVHNHKLIHMSSKTISQEVIKEITDQTLIRFDFHFINQFQFYVDASITRILFDEKVRTPIFEDSLNIYPMGYKLAEITSLIIEKHILKKMSSSDKAMFSIIFNNALFNILHIKKIILFISSYGDKSEILLKQKIQGKFNNKLSIKKTISYHELYKEDLSQYDFIISDTSINRNLNIPIITISQSFTTIDEKKIDNHFKYTYINHKLPILFHPNLFNNNVKINSLNELIHQFYKLISSQYPLLKKVTLSTLLKNKNCIYQIYADKVCLIKIHRPIHNNTILSVLELKKSLSFQSKKISIFIFISSNDPSDYIFNTIKSLLIQVTSNNNQLNDLLCNPNYVHFLSLLKKE